MHLPVNTSHCYNASGNKSVEAMAIEMKIIVTLAAFAGLSVVEYLHLNNVASIAVALFIGICVGRVVTK